MSAVPGSIPSAQLAPQTMAARRARIRILLSSVIVGSQDELRLMLAAEGIRVTQTTLSRVVWVTRMPSASPRPPSRGTSMV